LLDTLIKSSPVAKSAKKRTAKRGDNVPKLVTDSEGKGRKTVKMNSASTTGEVPEKTPVKPTKKLQLNPSGMLDVGDHLRELEVAAIEANKKRDLVAKVKTASLGMDLPPLPPAPTRADASKKETTASKSSNRVHKRQQ
jgi:hypothetical protein